MNEGQGQHRAILVGPQIWKGRNEGAMGADVSATTFKMSRDQTNHSESASRILKISKQHNEVGDI